MRNLITILLALSLFTYKLQAQQYEHYWDFDYLNDTIIVNGKKIVPGDTLKLGFGSGANKDFLFIAEIPKKVIALNYLTRHASNSFMVFKGVKIQKAMGKKIVTPIFWVKDQEVAQYQVDFKNAILAKEIMFE